jgi:hypothetical protein
MEKKCLSINLAGMKLIKLMHHLENKEKGY